MGAEEWFDFQRERQRVARSGGRDISREQRLERFLWDADFGGIWRHGSFESRGGLLSSVEPNSIATFTSQNGLICLRHSDPYTAQARGPADRPAGI